MIGWIIGAIIGILVVDMIRVWWHYAHHRHYTPKPPAGKYVFRASDSEETPDEG